MPGINKKRAILAGVVILLILVVGFGLVFWRFNLKDLIFKTKDPAVLAINKDAFIYKDEMGEEKYLEAVKRLEEVQNKLKADLSNTDLWFEFGVIKNYLGDKEGAIFAWEKTLELGPYFLPVLNNLGDVYADYGKDYERAESFYLRFLQKEPNYSVYGKLADLYRYNLTAKKTKSSR